MQRLRRVGVCEAGQEGRFIGERRQRERELSVLDVETARALVFTGRLRQRPNDGAEQRVLSGKKRERSSRRAKISERARGRAWEHAWKGGRERERERGRDRAWEREGRWAEGKGVCVVAGRGGLAWAPGGVRCGGSGATLLSYVGDVELILLVKAEVTREHRADSCELGVRPLE